MIARSIGYCALTATALTYGLIVLGALVRATNSGLSCPDWPTCYGTWMPTPAVVAAHSELGFTYTQVMLEWVHRLIAGILLGPLILGLAILTFIRHRSGPLRFAAVGLVLLLIIQAGLGGLTVLDANSPWSVAIHLTNALLLVGLLLFFVVGSLVHVKESANRTVISCAGLAIIVAMATMATAAITAKSGASMACSTWPLCNGALIPNLNDPLIAIHAAHRLLASFLTLLIAFLVWQCWDAAPIYRRFSLALFAAIGLQVALGAGLIEFFIPIPLAVLHQALAVAIFIGLVTFLWIALRRWWLVRYGSLPTHYISPTIAELSDQRA